ncbi:hypothetical protein [Sphingobium sp. CAP-1]|uniref:hypothetical protein n=1 Tax=Sphingobium sp. CAP-1 TaxID=2676077 RepID=UPI0012BB2171|nr:hypothetical protein [Sphingobium sp. CAP-1]QGP80015.1 hypothetical protein GL174_14240 [Sphingobium sp. CAP-1]
MSAMPRKTFCRQCNSQVALCEAVRCRSRFCKVKQDWPVTPARYESAELLATVSNSPPLLCQIIFTAAGDDKAMVADLRSNLQGDPLCRLRHAIAWAGKELGFSYHSIGRALNRDHSSVMHSHRVALRLVPLDDAFRLLCEDLARVGESAA